MSENKDRKSKKKNVKKPNPFVYYPASLIVGLFLRLGLNTTYDRSAIRHISKPSVVVCPHVSNIDFLLVAMALFPHRPTFVASRHFTANPVIRQIFKVMHVITKKNVLPGCENHSRHYESKRIGKYYRPLS